MGGQNIYLRCFSWTRMVRKLSVQYCCKRFDDRVPPMGRLRRRHSLGRFATIRNDLPLLVVLKALAENDRSLAAVFSFSFSFVISRKEMAKREGQPYSDYQSAADQRRVCLRLMPSGWWIWGLVN